MTGNGWQQFTEGMTQYGRGIVGAYVWGMLSKQMLDNRTPEQEAAWYDQLTPEGRECLSQITRGYRPSTPYTRQLAALEDQIKHPGVWEQMQQRNVSVEEVAARLKMSPQCFINCMTKPDRGGRGLRLRHMEALADMLRTSFRAVMDHGGAVYE
jgi:hypothetical protein